MDSLTRKVEQPLPLNGCRLHNPSPPWTNLSFKFIKESLLSITRLYAIRNTLEFFVESAALKLMAVQDPILLKPIKILS